MAGTLEELKRFAEWQLERIGKGEDPTDALAFITYIRETGGDTTRLGDYGFPQRVRIEPAYFPRRIADDMLP